MKASHSPYKSYTCKHMAIRRVSNGSICIGGRRFNISDMCLSRRPYNGELDGMWLAFGRYYDGPDISVDRITGKAYVSLWGTSNAYWSADSDTDWPGPNCIDGHFYWEWWNEV